MAFYTISIASEENFDPKGYIDYNEDVSSAYGYDYERAREHLLNLGIQEGRKQFNYDVVNEVRSRKRKVLDKILNLEKDHIIHENGTFDFLNTEIKQQFRVYDTDNISANPYDYEGYEYRDDCLVLDCGAGFRHDYYENVVNFEIVNYMSTDVVGVGEDLPFLDNSFDVVFSYAVLEHTVDPVRCAAELCRVLKPGGRLYCDAVFMQPFHGYPSHYFNFTRSGARLLFDTYCDIISQSVPLHLHPIFSLTWICKEWARGLTGSDLDAFYNTTIKELTEMSIEQFVAKPFVRRLPSDIQEIIAAGTRIVAEKKRGLENQCSENQ